MSVDPRAADRAVLSLQLAQVLDAVVARGRAVIGGLYPPRSAAGEPSPAAALLPSLRRSVSWAGAPGVVQQLELRRLVDAATQADAVLVFRVGVVDSLHETAPRADLLGGDLPDRAVRAAVIRGAERPFDQDPMLAVLVLADIGLRALSPGGADPGGLERLRRLLADLLEMSPSPRHAPLIRLSEQVQARLGACRPAPTQDPASPEPRVSPSRACRKRRATGSVFSPTRLLALDEDQSALTRLGWYRRGPAPTWWDRQDNTDPLGDVRTRARGRPVQGPRFSRPMRREYPCESPLI